MKKFINTIAIVLAVASLASCSMFKLDNFDGPNAQIHGKVLDAKTGEPIGVEAAFSQEVDWANVEGSCNAVGQRLLAGPGACGPGGLL